MRRLSILVALAVTVLIGCGDGAASPPRADSTVPPSSIPSIASGSPPSTVDPIPSASPSAAAGPAPPLSLEPVVGGLDNPVDIAWRPADPDTLFVVEQGGLIRVVRGGTLVDRPFLDLSGIVTAGGERGLLGLAFLPSGQAGRFFVYYTALDESQVLASYDTVAADPDQADPGTARVWLIMADQFGNHNGGSLAFGPDGFLHVGTGDGGGGGDPLDSGRRLDTLLAKILRLDVEIDGDSDIDPPYGIPPGNPFIDTPDARPEIWLTGLRNPWRIRFDRSTGDLWIGDVGQSEREEINVARAGVGGLDFGWNIMEGTSCYRDEGSACHTPDLTLPVTEYGSDQGCAITGGTVYRGTAQPALQGRYVFADYCSGRFWAIDPVGDDVRQPTLVLDSGRSISAIGEDAAGELYATDYAGGELLHIVVAGG